MLDHSSMMFPETAHFSGRVVHAFCCLVSTLDNYIRFTGSLPDNPENLYTSSCSSLCQEDYGLIEDYLDENYSNITINDLINIPLPVNESLVLVFEGFKRAYETLEKTR